ncbi:MAG TPA: tetratricopeptide repeat protein [Drouetiella sp.]
MKRQPLIASMLASALLFLAPQTRAASTSTAGPIGDKWAVVIGLADFADPTIPKLHYSAKDAKDFYDYLVDQNGGRFAKDHVKLLTNSDATKVNIMDVLGDSFLPHGAAPGDLVVIYLSTHGSPAGADINGVNYVVAYDTQVNKMFATGIEMKQLIRIIKERVHTNRILLVMDTCYSGAGAVGDSHKGLSRSNNINPSALAQGSGSIVMSSSATDQRAWESDSFKNSYFTHYMIEALKAPGTHTIDQDFAALKQKVQADVLKDRGELQTPVMATALTGSSFVLNSAPTVNRQAPVTVPYGSDTAGAGSTADGKSSTLNFASYGAHKGAAENLIRQHKLWDAIHELQLAVKDNPSSVDAYLSLADAYDEQGRYAEALESANRAVVNDNSSTRGHEALGRAYIRNGNSDEALRQIQLAIGMDPTSSEAQYLLGFLDQYNNNRVDEAEQQYRKALALDALNVKALVNLGTLLVNQNRNIDEAEGLFNKAIDADSEDWQARLGLANILYKYRNKPKEAEAQIRKATELAPANSRLHSELGRVVALDKDRYAEAEAEFKKGIELAPNMGLPASMFAAFLLTPLGRVDESEKEYRRAIALDPNLDEARVGLGNLLVDYRKVYDESDDQFKKALKINPKSCAAYIGLGHIDTALYKNYKSAEQNFKKAITIQDSNSYAHDQLGQLYFEYMNFPSEAQNEFEKAIKNDPSNALAHYHYGVLLISLLKGNENNKVKWKDLVDRSQKELQAAIQSEPGNSMYQTALANLLVLDKQYKAAEPIYRKALESNLADADAHCKFGLLLIEHLSRRSEGEEELKKAHALKPDEKAIQTVYDRFVH